MVKSLDIIDPKKDSQNQNEEAEMTAEDVGIKTQGQGGVFYLILGIIALVVATSAALYILYNDKGDSSASNSETDAASTSTPLASETASAVVSLTPSSTVSAQSNSTVSQFKYTNEQIRVVNGNGVAGEAAKIKKILEGKGFKVASVANASKNYTQSIIYYKKGQDALAQALKDAINDQYAATAEEASIATVGQYDAVIALGSK